MSTHKQLTAYRNILAARHEDHLRKTYGMLPLAARHPGKCGCGTVYGRGRRCDFNPGDKIAKFKGAWWNVACIDQVQFNEVRANARFVREILTSDGWKAYDWTNDAKSAAIWREELAEIDGDKNVRVTDRQEVR